MNLFGLYGKKETKMKQRQFNNDLYLVLLFRITNYDYNNSLNQSKSNVLNFSKNNFIFYLIS